MARLDQQIPVFIVEVKLGFSHQKAAEKDQGGLQEKHQVWLEMEEKLKLFFGHFWSLYGPQNFSPGWMDLEIPEVGAVRHKAGHPPTKGSEM